MVDLERTKRAQLELLPPMEKTESTSSLEEDDDDDISLETMTSDDSRTPPKSFICPLTQKIMFDPVMDTEGNSFERSALKEWLRKNRRSPLGQQPLTESMLLPNKALREAIHECMGHEWVHKRTLEDTDEVMVENSAPPSFGGSKVHARIDSYLQNTGRALGGFKLRLNEQGCCAFRYDGVTIVVDVPDKVGVFCFYTRNLLPCIRDEPVKNYVYRRALEMNFLQGDTRGGCLSLRKHQLGQSELIFSYTDRAFEVNPGDFTNVLLNFVRTAVSLRDQLVQAAAEATASMRLLEQQQCHFSPMCPAVPMEGVCSAAPVSPTLPISQTHTLQRMGLDRIASFRIPAPLTRCD